MKRLYPFAALALSAAICAAMLPAPVLAQDHDGEKVNQLIVFGDDPCPPSTQTELVVCARKGEGERFRIPEPLRDDPNKTSNQAWTERVKAYETVGASGIDSCSPVGSGGATGCLKRLIANAYAERRQSSDVHFAKLIEAERAKRLSTVDADAAADQARVESLEKQYDARIARERAAGDAQAGPAAPAVGALAAPPADPVPAPHQ